jgi:hypothetical protein
MVQVWAVVETNGTVSGPASAGLLICTEIRFVDAAPSLLCLVEYPIASHDQPYAAATTARDGEMRSCAPARGPPRRRIGRDSRSLPGAASRAFMYVPRAAGFDGATGRCRRPGVLSHWVSAVRRRRLRGCVARCRWWYGLASRKKSLRWDQR